MSVLPAACFTENVRIQTVSMGDLLWTLPPFDSICLFDAGPEHDALGWTSSRSSCFGPIRAVDLRMKTAAIVLIVIGIGIVIWGAFGFQTRERVLDVGPIHASRDTKHNVPYGPLAGALLAVGGVILLVKNKD